MRFIIYGDTTPASGGWCYAETLRDMGHDVRCVSDSIELEKYQYSLLSKMRRKLIGGISKSDRNKHCSHLQKLARQFSPDIIIILKGLHISGQEVDSLRKRGAWVCNVNHDDFFSANRNNWSQTQRLAIPHYDFIFTTREINVEEIVPHNEKVEFFPFAYYPKIHRPVELQDDPSGSWRCDVGFVGTYERPRAKMLEYLIKRLPIKLFIYGSQWERLGRFSPLRGCIRSSDIRFDDLSKAIGGACISLGFLRKENRDDYTQRTFEIPACGGLLLAERTAKHEAFYKENVEAVFFDANDPEQLCDKVKLLINNAEYCENVRKAGMNAVIRGNHSYKDRLQRLLEVYGRRSS